MLDITHFFQARPLPLGALMELLSIDHLEVGFSGIIGHVGTLIQSLQGQVVVIQINSDDLPAIEESSELARPWAHEIRSLSTFIVVGQLSDQMLFFINPSTGEFGVGDEEIESYVKSKQHIGQRNISEVASPRDAALLKFYKINAESMLFKQLNKLST
jgi:hypothetical protein